MSGSWLWKAGVAAGVIVVVVAGLELFRGPLGSRLMLPVSSSVVAEPIGELPNIPEKQEPVSYTLDGCPPEGKGGDSRLNLLKNRTDPGAYADVSFDALTTLTWPKNIERLSMDRWPQPSRNYISQYAGAPVSVEGYVVNVREGPPEPAVCNWSNTSYLDWHLSFTQGPRDERSQAVVAEVTPRIRLNHRWTIDAIHNLIMGDHVPVRLSGWLYFDPEHPGDVGLTRATLWEINPVMQIEVLDKNRWVPLDSIAR
ncbi:MAG TPA: hypothetical protein VMJ64_02825 [Anaerolineales bacterium]|nr:hypothetical protein [Anaerolineales bacterium]